MRRVNVQTLVDLMNGRRVDPWELTESAEALYKSAKVVGISKTVAVFLNEKDAKVEVAGDGLDVRVRAIAAFVVRLIYRWDDMSSGRLEEHFGLPLSIQNILQDTPIFTSSSIGTGIGYLTVQQVVDMLCRH